MTSPATYGQPDGDEIIAVAVVANSLPPYRVHVHERIVREMPDVQLWSLVTHDEPGGRWRGEPPASIRPVQFGDGGSTGRQGSLAQARHEWRTGGRVIEFLKEKRVAAVVLLGYNDAGRLRVFAWCRRHGVPVMIWGDSNILGDNPTGLKRLLKRRLLRPIVSRADAILACGSRGRSYFERYGARPERVFYFTNEPDYELIAAVTDEQLAAVAEEFGLEPSRRRIVFSARMVDYKRPDLALDAFARLADERPEWDLLMLGDGELRRELQGRLPASLASRVTWGGFLDDQAKVSALYRLCDVMVLPSDYEPWALVINEAAAAGLAIVCTDVVGAAAELVADGRNGFLVPPGDLDALIEAICRATEPERVDALKAASADVLASWRRAADPVEELRRALQAVGALANSPRD